MPEQRRVGLFRDGRNQAVGIPVELSCTATGDRPVIEPMRKRGLVDLLKTMKPQDAGLPEIDDPAPAPESLF
jgi:antitoxin VapB